MADLLEIYVPVLRAYLVRSGRVPPELVADLLHDFVTDKVLARKLLHHADPSKGKFRNYLLRSLNNFVATKMKRENRLGAEPMGFDGAEVADPDSPDVLACFERELVGQVVHEALDLMRAGCEDRGRMDLWRVFTLRVVDPMLHGEEPVEYGEIVRQLRIETPRQAINLLATAKRSFVRYFHIAAQRYVVSEADVEAEVADLLAIVRR